MIESLEQRKLLSATLVSGVLTIDGTAANDRVELSVNSGMLWAKLNGASQYYGAQSGLSRIVVNLGDGNDTTSVGWGVMAVTLNGGNGNDTLNGGFGNDLISAGPGYNAVYGGVGNDTIYAGDNNDTISGNDGNDVIWAGGGNDMIGGSAGNDTLHGGEGNDSLWGSAGDDVLEGDGGYDWAHGDVGADVFSVEKIYDWTSVDKVGSGTTSPSADTSTATPATTTPTTPTTPTTSSGSYTTVIDGRTLPASQQYPNRNVVLRYRPSSLADNGKDLVIKDVYIHDVTNMKGIHITPTWEVSRGVWASYRSITIENVRIDNLVRSVWDHMDAIYIDGSKGAAIPVTIRNVTINNGSSGVMSLFFTSGNFSTITLDNVRTSNIATPMLDMRAGTTQAVKIVNSPYFRLNVQGKPGSIGTITISNSPGAGIKNIYVNGVIPNPKVVYA